MPRRSNLRGALAGAGAGLRRRHLAAAGTLPTGFGALRALTKLDLGANGFTGSIPADLGACTCRWTRQLAIIDNPD